VAHAAVVQVAIDPASDAAHRHGILNDPVVPEVTSLLGFVSLHDVEVEA
jgi:Mg/Co/Ni transporter MgtE